MSRKQRPDGPRVGDGEHRPGSRSRKRRATSEHAGLTSRQAEVERPPEFDADRVRRLRKGLAVSQSVFADMLNVSGSTVRAWEQGSRIPDGSSLRLLEVAEKRPDALWVGVRTSRR
jgi:DNA-binding transcriptional regulator YiaG